MKQLGIFLLLAVPEIVIGMALIFLIYHYTNLNPWINGIIILSLFAIIAFEFYVFYPHFRKPRSGREEMIGLSGIAIEELNPEGQVKIRGEIWEAKAVDNKVKKGEKIEVVNMDGLKLLVRRI